MSGRGKPKIIQTPEERDVLRQKRNERQKQRRLEARMSQTD